MTQQETNPPGGALALRTSDLLPVVAMDPRSILSPDQVKLQAGQIQKLLQEVLIPGVHYGTMDGKKPKPGALSSSRNDGGDDDGKKKESLMLYQSAGEKLMLMFGLRPDYDPPVLEQERTQHAGFLDITVKCNLVHVPTGMVIGSAWGNANSRERRYRWRTVSPQYATAREKQMGTLELRQTRGGDSYEKIVLDVDPWEIKQTLLAQAQKRAMMRTVRCALAASDVLGLDEDQAAVLRDFADAEEAEVEIGTEHRKAADELRTKARDAAAAVKSGGAAKEKDNGKGAPAGMDPVQQEMADLRTHAADLCKKLPKIQDYTKADYDALISKACGGRGVGPADFTKDELVALIQAASLVLSERGGDMKPAEAEPGAQG